MSVCTLEIIDDHALSHRFKYAVFDFDGTLSLIRQGWQQIMIPYFTDEMRNTPKGKERTEEDVAKEAREFIYVNTGKQTIYQCIELAERINAMGGHALDPQAYKDEYIRRLLIAIDGRLTGLENGTLAADDLLVPGSRELLTMLRRHNVAMYLASGTDHDHVLREASLLRVTEFFDGHIYGAQRDYKTFSKKMVIDRIINENHLAGDALVGFGDGYVEIENIRSVEGFAVGVASDEAHRTGIDDWKRERLIRAGANIIIPDFRNVPELEAYLFG